MCVAMPPQVNTYITFECHVSSSRPCMCAVCAPATITDPASPNSFFLLKSPTFFNMTC